jgi:hypothetical protein
MESPSIPQEEREEEPGPRNGGTSRRQRPAPTRSPHPIRWTTRTPERTTRRNEGANRDRGLPAYPSGPSSRGGSESWSPPPA